MAICRCRAKAVYSSIKHLLAVQYLRAVFTQRAVLLDNRYSVIGCMTGSLAPITCQRCIKLISRLSRNQAKVVGGLLFYGLCRYMQVTDTGTHAHFYASCVLSTRCSSALNCRKGLNKREEEEYSTSQECCHEDKERRQSVGEVS